MSIKINKFYYDANDIRKNETHYFFVTLIKIIYGRETHERLASEIRLDNKI